MIHLEPQVEPDRLQANTARTMLLLDHEPLPWSRWGEEFAAAMPEEIQRLQERAASADGTPRQEAIRSRVATILPLYRLSRYRPTPPPRHHPPPPDQRRPRRPARTPSAKPAAPNKPPTTDATALHRRRRVAATAADGEPPADGSDRETTPDAIVDLPDVAWISARDGTRAPGDLEDQAARYHPARHELTINADFRAINDLTTHWHRRYPGVPGARAVIEAQVREWCEQVLVEVVLAARNSTWSQEQLDALLSPTAFTAALLPTASAPRDAPETPGPEARRTTDQDESMSRPIPNRARQLAAELEQRFAQDAGLARKLNDAHQRLQRANARPWSGLHPDGIATVYGEHPAAVDATVAENRSEILRAPDPLQAIQHVHWQIHRAHCDYQHAAEKRRCLAAEIGEITRTFLDELEAAGWSEHDARNTNVHELARSGQQVSR